MKDEDIYAFGAPDPAASRPPPAPARRGAGWRWALWVLLGVATLVLLLAGAGAWAMLDWVGSVGEGVQVSVNGEPWSGLHADTALHSWGVLGLAAGLLVLLVVLPVVLMLVLLSVAGAVGLALLAVVAALVLAVLCVLLVLAVVLSPLWGILLLVWLLVRPRRKAGLASGSAGAAARA